MSTPRLKGNTLGLVRRMAATAGVGGVVWNQLSRDYGLAALRALPAEARPALDVEPRPLQGAPPRSWAADDSLPPPPVRPGTCAALTAAYAAGSTTPVEVLASIRGAIEAEDFGASTHSPFVSLALQRAERAARASTERWARGEARGPLDGVPVGVKDEHDMVGLPTRGGTRYLDKPATADSFCVGRLDAGGALLFAKTHATEWGMSPIGFSAHHSMPRNPWSSEHAPGGSSTGSAVAVALGLAPVAVASDGGGSIRIPAAWCGVFGLKPTFIRTGRTGDIFAGNTVSHIGPIGRSTRDLVDFLEVAASRHDPDDPVSGYAVDLPEVVPRWRAALGRGVRGCRIGVPAGEWEDAAPELVGPAEAALRALEADGAVLVDVEVPYAEHAPAVGVLVIAGETMGGLTDDFVEHSRLMGDDLRLILHLLEQAPLRDYFIARRTRAFLRRALARTLAGVDLMALPTVAGPAPTWVLGDDCVAIADDDATRAATRFAFLGNLTGVPCGTVPVGRAGQLPVGLQLMGDAWDEASVLAAMAHVERLGLSELGHPTGFHHLPA